MNARTAAGARSCPSSPLQQSRVTPPSSGRCTPLPSLLPLILGAKATLPRAAAALAALSLEVPTAEARESVAALATAEAAAPIASRPAAVSVDPIEAENEALADFVSWLIANGEELWVTLAVLRGEER